MTSIVPSIIRAGALSLPLALALAAPMAQAQSVSISGTIDLGVYRGFDKRTQVGPISRSNLAFSGSEDLGGGLLATFRLSTRFDPDTGTVEDGYKPFWHGESTVGIKGAFGSVRFGRALDAVWANDWAYDPWGNFDRIASPAWQLWHYNYASDRTGSGGQAEYGRINNGVFYDSPSFGPVSFSLSGSPEKSTTATGNQRTSLQGMAKYSQGPVTASIGHGSNGHGDTVLFVGGKYSLGNLTLMGAYDRSEYKAAIASVARSHTLGATYQMGLLLLQAGYGHLSVDGAKQDFIGLGAQYTLSKRTYVYADYGNRRPDGAAQAHAYGVGVNHSF